MSVPLWVRDADPQVVRTGVAVVGAGIAGLSAARSLGELGIDCVVLESGTPGCGASTRNAGYLMRGAADHYAGACHEWGREEAARLWRATEQNHALLRVWGADRLESYVPRPSCLVAFDDEDAGRLDRSAAWMREDGFEVEWRTEGEDSLWASGRARAGLENPYDACVNPAELVGMLLGAVRDRVRLGFEVYAIEREGPGVVVRAQGAGQGLDVVCERVLVCTNAWADRLVPGLGIEANRGQMLAVRATGVRLDANYYVNRGHDYVRPGPSETVLLGGRRHLHEQDERTHDAGWTAPLQASLEEFLREVFGLGALDVVARWGGVMGFSPTGRPLTGAADDDGRVWVCAGFTGHGMSLGAWTARETARAMALGTAAPFGVR